MRRQDISELHYITPIANLPSICQDGILSHRRATARPHDSVAMEIIQRRRTSKAVPNGLPLHDYVNLYFHARNPMLYSLRQRHSSLCVLRVSPNVFDLPSVVITSQNASSDYVRFYPSPQGLDYLDYDLVFAESWTHPDDQLAEWRHKSVRCAEVLVPNQINVCYIIGAYVSCQSNLAVRESLVDCQAIGFELTVNSHLFFL